MHMPKELCRLLFINLQITVKTLICCFVVAIGTAIRHCSDDKGWLPPQLFNCTSVSFAQLKKEVIRSLLLFFYVCLSLILCPLSHALTHMLRQRRSCGKAVTLTAQLSRNEM